MKKLNGLIYALLSGAAFGVMPIFAKIAYNNGLNATTVLSFRFLVAAVILFFYCVIRKESLKINKKQLLLALLIGAVEYTLTTQTLFVSYNYIGVGLATALHFIYPASVCVISFLFYKEKMSKSKIISLIVSCVGVYLLVGLNLQSISIKGVTLALFSGVSYSLTVIGMNAKEIKKLNNTVATFYISLFAGITIFLMGLFTNNLTMVINPQVVMSLGGVSIISTIISMVLLMKAVKIIGPTTASILATFEPIVSMVMGVLFLGEKLTLFIVIGTILILASVVLLAKDKPKDTLEEGSADEEIKEKEIIEEVL